MREENQFSVGSYIERSEQTHSLPREGEDGRGRAFMPLFASFIIGK